MNLIVLLVLSLGPRQTVDIADRPFCVQTGAGDRTLYIATQHASQWPQLFQYREGTLRNVELADDSLYVCAHPKKKILYVVAPHQIRVHNAETLQLEDMIALDSPLPTLPCWQFAQTLDRFVFLPQDAGMAIYDLSLHQLIYRASNPSGSSRFPQVTPYGNAYYWMIDRQLNRWSDGVLDAVEDPFTNPLEQGIPVIHAGNNTVWFRHGGRLGDLDSFGWSLKGSPLKGEGILTRFSQDIGMGRMAFTTVSNQVSSHLYNSILGRRVFQCHVIEWVGQNWKVTDSREFQLKKGDGVFGVYWPGDLDGDGLKDMVVCDKKGMRWFKSNKHKGFSGRGQKLGDSPGILFNLKRGIAWAASRGNQWRIQWSTP